MSKFQQNDFFYYYDEVIKEDSDDANVIEMNLKDGEEKTIKQDQSDRESERKRKYCWRN